MPKLWRYADGHGHFIRRFLHAGGRVMTYQVTPEGVAFLAGAGVNVHARSADIPSGLVDALNDRGFLYTGHSGLGDGAADELLRLLEMDVPTSPSRDQTSETPALGLGRLPPVPELVFRHGDPWSLELAIEPLTSAALPEGGVSAWTRALTECHIVLAGGRETASGLELWPGGRGVRLPALPGLDDYRLELCGIWTDDMRAGVPHRALPGLAANGSLFDDEPVGRRLRPGDPLVLGGRYVLVLPQSVASANPRPRAETANQLRHGGTVDHSASEVPPDVQVRDLGSRDGWQALLLVLPAKQSSVRLREWARRLGHPLHGQLHRLELVAPVPIGYTAQGQPMVPRGRPVLLRLTPAQDDEWRPANLALRAIRSDGASVALVPVPQGTHRVTGGQLMDRSRCGASVGAVAQYLVFAPPASGEYRIVGDTGWTNLLQVVVVPPVGEDADSAPPTWLGPAGLQVRIGDVAWFAFGTSQPETARVLCLPLPKGDRSASVASADDRESGGLPHIAVESPAVRLSLSAAYDGVVVERRVVPQTEAPLILRQWLGGGTRARRIELSVDAGAGFGSVSMVVTWDRPDRSTAKHAVRTRMQTWMRLALPRLAAQAADRTVLTPALTGPASRGIPAPASLTPLVRHLARHHLLSGPTVPISSNLHKRAGAAWPDRGDVRD